MGGSSSKSSRHKAKEKAPDSGRHLSISVLFRRGIRYSCQAIEREELEEPITKGGRHEDNESDPGPSDLFGPCRMRFGWGWQDSYRAGRPAGHLRMPLHLQPRMVWKEVDPKKHLADSAKCLFSPGRQDPALRGTTL